MLLGSGEQASFRPAEFGAYYRRVRSRLERFVADPPPTEPLPVDHCRICDFKPLCDARWDAVDHLSRVAGVYRTPDRAARHRRDHDARGSRARAARARSGGDAGRHVGEDARAGRAPALGPRARPGPLRPPAAAAGERLLAPARIRRPATSSSTSRATRSGTATAASSTSGGSSTSRGTSRRCTPTTTRPSGRRSRRSSTSSTRGSSGSPTCTSTTTRSTRSPRSGG